LQQQPALPKVIIYAVEKNPSAVLYLQSMLYLSRRQQEQQQKQQDYTMFDAARNRATKSINNDNDHPWYGTEIHIIQEDLRNLSATKHTNNRKADIIVSELLGSFGCNELSPECLHALFTTSKKSSVGGIDDDDDNGEEDDSVCDEHTISIPCEYTSYIAPVSSTKLYQQACQQSLYPNASSTACIGYQQAIETPYVVRPHAASQMHTEQPCWSFKHGKDMLSYSNNNQNNKTKNHRNDAEAADDLERTATISFGNSPSANPTFGAASGCGFQPVDEKVAMMLEQLQSQQPQSSSSSSLLPCWILNGFLGTFTATLYYSARTGEKISLSTAPNHNFSTGMFSWFPLYFPLIDPILIPSSQHAVIELSMDRCHCTDTSRVWYEWSVQVLLPKTQQPVTLATAGNNNGFAITTHDHDEYTSPSLLYVSPIHNPNGRSYHVAM
jgi:type II protein arginine methyltransferase